MNDPRHDIPHEYSYGQFAEPSGDAGAAINPALVWLTVRRWWLVCVPIGLLLTALGCAVVWFTFEPVFESIGYLRIESTAPYIVYPGDDRGGAGAAVDKTVRTQVELIRSAIVLDRVLERAGIASMPAIRALSNPVLDLAKKIKVTSANESELYTVSYAASDPNDACTMVNAVLQEYIRQQETDLKGRNEFLIQLLQAESAQRRVEMTAKRNTMMELAEKVPGAVATADAPPEKVAEQAEANEWASQLAGIEVEQAIIRATIKSLENAAQIEAEAVPDAVLDQMVAQTPDIQQLTSDLQQAKVMRAGAREGSPVAQRYARRVTELERQVQTRSDQIREEMRVVAARNDRARRTADHSAKIEELTGQLRAYEGMAETWREKLQAYNAKLRGTGAIALELQCARREYFQAEDAYNRMNQRINELRTEARAPARVTLLRAATPALKPVEELPWKQFIAVLLAALALPFGLALLWEFRAQRVGAAGQIQGALSLPVLAEVTSLPQYPRLTNRRATDSYHAQRAAFENSIHYLCRNLLLAAEQADSRVFAVTSAVSGEGKTNLASVLSISLALAAHESVLLIDGDMRRPDLHAMFDLPLSPGLADLLVGDCAAAAAVQPTQSEGVFLMPAGRLGAHPHSVLGKDRLRGTLDRLRADYRYIIVDTPPVLSVGETLSVCNLVDGVILCAMRDVSLRRQVEEAYNRLNGTGAKMFGVVLNGVHVKAYSSRYGEYYYVRRQAK